MHRRRELELSGCVDAQHVVDAESARYLAPTVRPGNEERRRGRIRRDAIRGNDRDGLSMGDRVAGSRIEYVVKSRAGVVVESFVVAGSKGRFSTLKLDDAEQTGFARVLNSHSPGAFVPLPSGSPDYPEISTGIHHRVPDPTLEHQADQCIDGGALGDSAQIEC